MTRFYFISRWWTILSLSICIMFIAACTNPNRNGLAPTGQLDSLVLNFDSINNDWRIEYVEVNDNSDTTSIGLESVEGEALLRLFYNSNGQVDLIRYFPTQGHEARIELDSNGCWLCLESLERAGEPHLINQYWLKGDGTKTLMGSSEYWDFLSTKEGDSCYLDMISFRADSISFVQYENEQATEKLEVEVLKKGHVRALLPCDSNVTLRATIYSTLPDGRILFYYRQFDTELEIAIKPEVTIGTGKTPLKFYE